MQRSVCDEEIKLNNLIASNIKREMKKRFISYADMGSILGISTAAFYGKMKRSKYRRKFSIFELQKISDELMMPVDELLKE